jgi:TolA-binding protein
MLNPKKKLAKKEIKQDPLLTSYERASGYYYSNQKLIMRVGIGILVLIAVAFWWADKRRTNNELAMTELGKVYRIYDQASTNPAEYTNAINGQTEKGIVGLKAIVDKYGGSDGGELARYYLANCYRMTGKYDDAISEFKSFSPPTTLLKSAAQAGLGACHEAKKEFGDAASEYEKAANTASSPSVSPDYMMAAARCYGQAGQKDKAVEMLKRIKIEYPNAAATRDADRYIGKFSA